MQRFQNTAQALDFLVRCILGEAAQEGIELSPVERQMLAYSSREEFRFSALNAAFEAEVEYEETVSSLIRNLTLSDKLDRAAWHEAAASLGEDDYYLTVMIEMAKTSRPSASARPSKEYSNDRLYDRLKLLEQNQHNCTHRQRCQPGFFAGKNPTAQIPDRGHLC